MVPNLSSYDLMVTCGKCGAEWTIANPGLEDSITCGICGCVIHITQHNLHPALDAATPPASEEPAADSPEARMKEAIQLVTEEKYQDALKCYESVLAKRIDHRDAFYGLGFCHYKLGNYKDSHRLLRMAAELGHPHVDKLLLRVEERMREQRA